MHDPPPYTFIPGGIHPHPTSDPLGHSFGRHDPRPAPLEPSRWRESPVFVRGLALFNAGYYWEAHEGWEDLWHASGRQGPTADLLKALIKIAAAGVKVRQGQPHGVRVHLERAVALLNEVGERLGPNVGGLDLDRLIQACRATIASPPPQPPLADGPVACLGFTLGSGNAEPADRA